MSDCQTDVTIGGSNDAGPISYPMSDGPQEATLEADFIQAVMNRLDYFYDKYSIEGIRSSKRLSTTYPTKISTTYDIGDIFSEKANQSFITAVKTMVYNYGNSPSAVSPAIGSPTNPASPDDTNDRDWLVTNVAAIEASCWACYSGDVDPSCTLCFGTTHSCDCNASCHSYVDCTCNTTCHNYSCTECNASCNDYSPCTCDSCDPYNPPCVKEGGCTTCQACYGYSACVTCDGTCYAETCTCNAAAYIPASCSVCHVAADGCACNTTCYVYSENCAQCYGTNY